METQATLNQDGSITIMKDGKNIKYVLESDLGAVKASLKDRDGEVSKLQADLAGFTSKFDTEHQEVLKERAAREQFEAQAKEGVTLKTKVTELETKMADLSRVSGEVSNKLTERLKNHIKTSYKIPEEKLAGKALADLENIESTLQLTGVVPQTVTYDGRGGTGGTNNNLQGKSPLALATMGYESSDKKK